MVTIKKIKAQVSQSPVHGVIEVMHHFVVIWDTSGGYNFCSTYMYILFSQSTILNSLPMIYTGGSRRANVGELRKGKKKFILRRPRQTVDNGPLQPIPRVQKRVKQHNNIRTKMHANHDSFVSDRLLKLALMYSMREIEFSDLNWQGTGAHQRYFVLGAFARGGSNWHGRLLSSGCSGHVLTFNDFARSENMSTLPHPSRLVRAIRCPYHQRYEVSQPDTIVQ